MCYRVPVRSQAVLGRPLPGSRAAGLRGIRSDRSERLADAQEIRPDPQHGAAGRRQHRNGVIHKETHEKFLESLGAAIDECGAAGCPKIITVGEQRKGMSNAEGADNAVAFLNRMKARAEDKGVTMCVEVMNSKFDRPDQMCDHLAWGVDVIQRVNSPRVKILYDVYHAQIMDGDICRNIQRNFRWIAHFHTGGVPGRHEIDETQELNYRFIAKTIADLGYTGYIAHEFRPTPGRDPLQSLQEAIEIMTV